METIEAILEEASSLNYDKRVVLVSSLLEDLNPIEHDVSDEEALDRLSELKTGKVKGLSESEFWEACGR